MTRNWRSGSRMTVRDLRRVGAMGQRRPSSSMKWSFEQRRWRWMAKCRPQSADAGPAKAWSVFHRRRTATPCPDGGWWRSCGSARCARISLLRAEGVGRFEKVATTAQSQATGASVVSLGRKQSARILPECSSMVGRRMGMLGAGHQS